MYLPSSFQSKILPPSHGGFRLWSKLPSYAVLVRLFCVFFSRLFFLSLSSLSSLCLSDGQLTYRLGSLQISLTLVFFLLAFFPFRMHLIVIFQPYPFFYSFLSHEHNDYGGSG